MDEAVIKEVITKLCMQCDTGRAPVTRRCRLCHFLTCENCMPDGLFVCFHCMDTRVETREALPVEISEDEQEQQAE